MAFEDYPSNRQSRALHDVILATRAMYDRYPKTAVTLLRPILTNPKTKGILAEGILLGLIGSSSPDADRVVAGLKTISNLQANQLMVLLLAKHGRPLSQEQNEILKVMVRGGGGIRDPLRLQAAWAYLKQTHQSQLALASAVNR